MRLLRNLYQLAGCMYGVHENVYAVQTQEGIVLIDSGLDEQAFHVIKKVLGYWGLDRYKITKVLLTHAHYEHSGNCYRLEEEGAEICVHAAEKEAVLTGDDRVAAYGFPGAKPYRAVKDCTAVQDGEQIRAGEYSFEVIHVPGHSDGSVLYRTRMDNKIVMFTGDTVLADKLCQESMVGWTGGVDYNEAEYMESLRRLAQLEADVVLPGHGEVCMKDGGRLFNGAFLRARLLLATQPHTPVFADSMSR